MISMSSVRPRIRLMRVRVRPQGQGSGRSRVEIAGAVADDREGLLGEGGDDQFADLARGHRFQGLRIEDLDQEMILVDMQAVAFPAFTGHARSHDLGQPVVVGGDDAEPFVDLPAHRLGPGFGAEQAVSAATGRAD